MGMIIVKYLMLAACSSFLSLTLFYMTDGVFERRWQLGWIVLCLTAAAVSHLIFTAVVALQVFRVFITLAFPMLFTVCCYKGGSAVGRMGYSILIMIFFIVVDFVQGLLFSLLLEGELTQSFSFRRYAFYLVYLAGVILLYPKIKRILVGLYGRMRFSGYQIFMMGALLIFETMVINYMGSQFVVLQAGLYRIFFIQIMAGFFADLLMLYLLRRLDRGYALEKQQALMTQQASMRRAYYDVLERHYRESRFLLHDMKNHIAAIEGLYAAGEAQMAEAYVRRVLGDMEKTASDLTGAYRKEKRDDHEYRHL
ncbi:MAG: hypothetical protein Q4C55_06520 [Eubacterium sp.]|nr:hypothetical protein [Eubacterium sp.]